MDKGLGAPYLESPDLGGCSCELGILFEGGSGFQDGCRGSVTGNPSMGNWLQKLWEGIWGSCTGGWRRGSRASGLGFRVQSTDPHLEGGSLIWLECPGYSVESGLAGSQIMVLTFWCLQPNSWLQVSGSQCSCTPD